MQDTFTEAFLQQHFSKQLDIKIEYNNDRGRVICYCATVHSFQSDCLTISLADNEQLELLKVGQSLILLTDISEEKKNVYFQAVIQELLPGQPLILKLSRPEEVDIRYLREFFRCEVSLPFRYIDASVLEFAGEITNLSASGLSGVIDYDSTIKLNNWIEVQFKLPSHPKPLRLTAQIVRITSLSESKQEIAVQFTAISETCQNQIIKFLFAWQRLSRNSQRNCPKQAIV
jgi:hypothetical protein